MPGTWCFPKMHIYVWCIYLCSSILDYDACVHDAHIHDPGPDTCMCDAYIYVPQSLTMMHVCMMHISMILDLDPKHACMYGACVYDAANFVPNGRTDEQGDSRSLIFQIFFMLVLRSYVWQEKFWVHDEWAHIRSASGVEACAVFIVNVIKAQISWVFTVKKFQRVQS